MLVPNQSTVYKKLNDTNSTDALILAKDFTPNFVMVNSLPFMTIHFCFTLLDNCDVKLRLLILA